MLNIESALYVTVQATVGGWGDASSPQRFSSDMAYRVLGVWKPDGVLQPYLLLSNGAQRSFVPMGSLRAVAFAPEKIVYAVPLHDLEQDSSIYLQALVAKELSHQGIQRQALGQHHRLRAGH